MNRIRAASVRFAILVAAASTLLFPACARKTAERKKDRPLIGFAMDSLVEERWSRDRDVFMAMASSLGADPLIQVAEENARTQEEQVLYMLDKGIDALVLIAVDPDGLTRAVQEAKRRTVPVILYERIVRNGGADLYLAYDAAKTGELQAKSVVERIWSGTIAIYNGPRGDAGAEAAHGGIMKVLEPLVAVGRVKIVDDYWAKTAGSEEAFAFMDALLASGTVPDGVIASKDLYAEAVVQALSMRRLAGKTVVAGADADLAACQRIAEGGQFMTVYKPIEQIAAKAAELAVFLVRSDRFTVHNAIQDGSYRVPYYELEPVSVTADRLKDTVVKDGFHLEQDVYRNVLSK